MAKPKLLNKATVTLNGTLDVYPDFYAPADAGTSGQILSSTGAEPDWIPMPEGLEIVLSPTQPTDQKVGDFWYNTSNN